MASPDYCAIPILDDVDEEKTKESHPHEIDVEKAGHPELQDVHGLTGISYICSLIIVGLLAYINGIIHMDEFIAAGVLPDLKRSFQIDDSKSGLLTTVFMGSSVLSAPVFGYLGDRWNRKYIMSAGIAFWSIATLCVSFIPNEYFPLLLLMRGLVGAAAASCETIAPTIIADLFVADQRSRMLSIFYIVVPVGSGLGYITGAKVTSAANGDWHWAFRVTPGLGLLAVLLMLIVAKEPPRGAAEGRRKTSQSSNNLVSDVKELFNNPSFLYCTFGSTAVAFIASAKGLWAPTFLQRARILLQEMKPSQTVMSNYDDSLIFGVLTVISGILGVLLGGEISKRYRKVNPRADPLVCGCGLLGSAPFMFLTLFLGNISLVATYAVTFFGQILLNLNWPLVADILLYVVPPTRRSTAHAVQSVVSHLLGEAVGPYIIGLIADVIRKGRRESSLLMFGSLQLALMTCIFVSIVGGGFFFTTAVFIEEDRKKAEVESEV